MAVNETYEEFVEKFKPKRTTDDCYTPENIYNVVAEFVRCQYGRQRETFCRPFSPGGGIMKKKTTPARSSSIIPRFPS